MFDYGITKSSGEPETHGGTGVFDSQNRILNWACQHESYTLKHDCRDVLRTRHSCIAGAQVDADGCDCTSVKQLELRLHARGQYFG